MFRRSIALLTKEGRTIVRDPRKRRLPAVRTEETQNSQTSLLTPSQQTAPQKAPLPFQPTSENQQAVGSSLGSYVLMGAGMAVGFSIVGAIFGGI